jgi:hypothetical protein
LSNEDDLLNFTQSFYSIPTRQYADSVNPSGLSHCFLRLLRDSEPCALFVTGQAPRSREADVTEPPGIDTSDIMNAEHERKPKRSNGAEPKILGGG